MAFEKVISVIASDAALFLLSTESKVALSSHAVLTVLAMTRKRATIINTENHIMIRKDAIVQLKPIEIDNITGGCCSCTCFGFGYRRIAADADDCRDICSNYGYVMLECTLCRLY